MGRVRPPIWLTTEPDRLGRRRPRRLEAAAMSACSTASPGTGSCDTALLGSLPLVLATATGLPAVAVVGTTTLEQFATPPVGTYGETLWIEVTVISEVIRTVVDTASQVRRSPSKGDGKAGRSLDEDGDDAW